MFGGSAQLGLDIGSRYIKAVELTEQGDERYALTGYGIMEVDPELDPAQNVEQFRQRHDFSTDLVSTAVSGRSVIIRYVNMDESEEDQLESELSDQASKYIPFEIEDAIIDYERLPEETSSPITGEDEMRVLIVAAKEGMVNDHADLVERAGYQPQAVDIDALALGNAFDFYLHNNDEESEGNIVGLVDIGAEKSLVHIMDGSHSQFAREFDIGGDEFTQSIATRKGLSNQEAETMKVEGDEEDQDEIGELVRDKIDDLCHEIHLSFDFFETQFDKEVDEIYVSGGGSFIRGLEGVMEDVFELKPKFWNPFENVDINLNEGSPEQLQDVTRFLSVATGLAWRGYESS